MLLPLLRFARADTQALSATKPTHANKMAHDETHPQAHADTHQHAHTHAHDLTDQAGLDSHARSHARAIESRFANGSASFGQTLAFGLTGWHIPCPAAITVLLLCLNIDRFWLGVSMVTAFSAGLAVTLVAEGSVAALGVRHAQGHARGEHYQKLLAIAPFASTALVVIVGLVRMDSPRTCALIHFLPLCLRYAKTH